MKLKLDDPQLESQVKKVFSEFLLKKLHILTAESKLNQDSRRKIKQVMHLLGFIEPYLKSILAGDLNASRNQVHKAVSIVDMGAGKSYLGFMLYDYFLKSQKDLNPLHQVVSIESRKELISNSLEIQKQCNYKQMSFIESTIQEASLKIQSLAQEQGSLTDDQCLVIPDTHYKVVTALHACDTATDDSIDFALKMKADLIVLVPCCQAQMARSFIATPDSSVVQKLIEFPIHKREFGSHLTNVLRCMKLEANGYLVKVTELVGWEHSMKNELIIAEKKGSPRAETVQKLKDFLMTLPITESEKLRFLNS